MAHFKDSGGIFAGGEVVLPRRQVGQVGKLQLTDAGVDVYLDVEKYYDTIPADTLAVVGNRSAVGEQYVELQPQVDDRPYLADELARSRRTTPAPRSPTDKSLLTDISDTVESVDKHGAADDRRASSGTAFAGTGQDLQRIIDTGNSFIKTANANFDTPPR